jgi:hypothetical protein
MHKSAYTNKGIWNDTPKQKKNLRSVQFIGKAENTRDFNRGMNSSDNILM